MLVLATAVAVGALLFSVFLGPKRPSPQKQVPYESGMVPVGPGRRRISVKFYMIAMLFIVFDVEVVFLYPWAVVFKQLRLFGLIEMVIFLGILIVGYIYVWKKGALEWD